MTDMMQDLGGSIWFIGLLGCLVVLAAIFVFGRLRGRPRGGDPNAAWKQAAAETGHPEVARKPPGSAP